MLKAEAEGWSVLKAEAKPERADTLKCYDREERSVYL